MPSEIDLFSTRYDRGTYIPSEIGYICSTGVGLMSGFGRPNVRLYYSVTTCTYHCRGEYIQLVRPVQNKRACGPICFNQDLEYRYIYIYIYKRVIYLHIYGTMHYSWKKLQEKGATYVRTCFESPPPAAAPPTSSIYLFFLLPWTSWRR